MKNVTRPTVLFIILLLQLTPDALSEEGVHTENIVIILDASGSMKDKFSSDQTKTKMAAAKEALRQVVRKIPDGTNIGVLVFSGTNTQKNWVYPLSPKDDDELMKAISLPRPGGGTPLGNYIKIGADRLLEQREKQYNYGSYRLLVVTDGQATDPEAVKTYTPEVMDRQIRIDVIGVDMRQDHMLATVVDSYRRADNPGQLVKVVSEILAETSNTGTNTSGEDVFEFIAPLTENVALSLITAITKVPGNTPIGKQPMTPEPEATTPPPKQPPQPSQQNTPQASGQMWKVLLIGIAILAGVVLLVLRTSKRNRGN